MSRRRYISNLALGNLLLGLSRTMGFPAYHEVLEKHGPHRKRMWAAAHNMLNRSHPEGGGKRKHKWTHDPNRFETTK